MKQSQIITDESFTTYLEKQDQQQEECLCLYIWTNRNFCHRVGFWFILFGKVKEKKKSKLLFMLQCWGWIYFVSSSSFVKKGSQNQLKHAAHCCRSIKNEPFHNHLRWSTMSHSPGSGSSESRPQFNLNWIFISLCHFGTWYYKFKMVEGRREKPSPSGKPVKPSKTGCDNPFLCFLHWLDNSTYPYLSLFSNTLP